MAIDHTSIGVAELARSAAFYDAALGALGFRRVVEIEGGIGYGTEQPTFWIDRFHPHGTRNHTAFVARSHAEVDAFHAAAVAAGGTDNGAPSLRQAPYPAGYYAAFVHDPDGNNLEAVCRGESVLPVLETERLRLRPFRATDRDALFAVFSNAEVARYWAFPAWTDPAQAAAYLVPLLAPRTLVSMTLPWAIADRESDALIGTTTIHNLNREQGRGEIGYTLRRDRWGQGLAREAVSRVLAYGFDELKLRRFEADIDPRNAPSLGLIERFGFTREGYLRARWHVNDETCDSVVLGLLAPDFRR